MMKVLSYILISAITFLLVKPGIDLISFSPKNQKACCSSTTCTPIADHQESDSGNHQEKNTDGVCNPFQACCSCLLLCIKSPLYTIFKIEIPTEHFFEYQSHIASQFISDFWQPPRFV